MVEPKAEFGNYLTATRQKTGLSLEDIARSTGVAKRHLEALEQGRGELLPAGMHRRTILRSYATAVGLESRATVERFERIFGPSLTPLVITGSPAGKSRSTLWRRAITLPVRCARGVTGSIARMARWIIGLPGRAVRWVFTSIVRPIHAAILWSARLARGVVQSFVNTVKWTAQIPVYAFERVV